MGAIPAPQFTVYQPQVSPWEKYAGPPHQLLQNKLGPNYPSLIFSLIVTTTLAHQVKYIKPISSAKSEVMAFTLGGNLLGYVVWNRDYFNQSSPPPKSYSVPTWAKGSQQPELPIELRQLPLTIEPKPSGMDLDDPGPLPPDESLEPPVDPKPPGMEPGPSPNEDPDFDPYAELNPMIVRVIKEMLARDKAGMEAWLCGELKRIVDLKDQLIKSQRSAEPSVGRLLTTALSELACAQEVFGQHREALASPSETGLLLKSPVNQQLLAVTYAGVEHAASVVKDFCKESEQAIITTDIRTEFCMLLTTAQDAEGGDLYRQIRAYDDGTCTYQVMQLYLMLMEGECTYDQLHDPKWCQARQGITYHAPASVLEGPRIKVDTTELQKELAAYSKQLVEEEFAVNGKPWKQLLQEQMQQIWLNAVYGGDNLRGVPDATFKRYLQTQIAEFRRSKEADQDFDKNWDPTDNPVTKRVFEEFMNSEDENKGWQLYLKMQAMPRFWGTELDWFLFSELKGVPVFQMGVETVKDEETNQRNRQLYTLPADARYTGSKLKYDETADGLRFDNIGNHYDLILRMDDIKASNLKYKELHPEDKTPTAE